MKWFKHLTDSYINLKHREIIEDFGLEGYGFYWLCLELIGQQGSNFRLNGSKSWKKALKSASRLPDEKMDKILNRFAQLNLICHKSLKKGDLYIPKMKERADEWTTRSSRETHELLRLDKKRREHIYNIRNAFVSKKNYSKGSLTPAFYARTGKAINTLLKDASFNSDLVIKGIDWMSKQKYEWTLETLIKHWQDFIKETQGGRKASQNEVVMNKL